ncbi:MAG: SMI1/KNR4 family protein [Myxococcales bacterium]|nr:SMI1/KNR4 family protein [Myxococcales bacterium]
MTFDRTLPPTLAALAALPFDYADGDGIDFEPYDQFLSAEDTGAWIRAWTGNDDLDGAAYRVFGQDGSGGYAALWLTRAAQPLEAQPVVMFGSEGELGVVAGSVRDFVWLLAAGVGPYEATSYGAEAARAAQPALAAFAATLGDPRDPAAIIADARAEFPTFEDDLRALCR